MHILFISKLALFVWYLFVVARIAYFLAIFMYFLHVHTIVANNNFPCLVVLSFLILGAFSYQQVWLVQPQALYIGLYGW